MQPIVRVNVNILKVQIAVMIYPIVATNELKFEDGKLHILCKGYSISDLVSFDDIGETIFLTKKEAEQALAYERSLKMKIEKIGHGGEYDFFIRVLNQKIKVASLRSRLMPYDEMFLYIHFPTEEKITLDLKYHTCEEVFEQAKKIVQKKLYACSQDILQALKQMGE